MENIFDKENIVVNVLDSGSFDDEFNFNIKQTVIWANSNDEKVIDKLNKKFKKTGGDENMNEMDELDELDMLLNEDIKEVKESEILDEIIIVSNIHIFHLDNIKTFKEKIFLETSIQPYLQHICIYYKNTFIPIGYNIVGNVINIKNIVDLQRYEGIPVDQKIYSNKDSIIVNALDNFTLLEQIYNKYGTTTFYLVDLNSFIKPLRGNLEQIIKDVYSLDLIYYSFILTYWPQVSINVFTDLIINEKNIELTYPILHIDKKIIKQKYLKETKLMIINDQLEFEYYYKSVVISNEFNYLNNLIDLRTIFDSFILNEIIYASIYYFSDSIIIKKTFNNNTVKHSNMDEICLIFYIKIPEYKHDIQFILKDNGTYYIKTKWFENEQKSLQNIFNVVYEIVNSIIEKINKSNNIKIQILSKNNIIYSDIIIGTTIPKTITSVEFLEYKNKLKIFLESGIFMFYNENIKPEIINYALIKGMFSFNIDKYNNSISDNNRFSYLYDDNSLHKMEMILKNKILTINHRTNELYFEVTHLQEKETYSVIFLINILMSICSTEKKDSGIVTDSNKKLKILKETDPVLYSSTSEENNYGRICQKQKQPSIVDSNTKGAVEFWNYTKQRKEYYKCISEEYKYLGFITNKHPNNYCLPCCYKLAQTEHETYSPCINNKEYLKEKKNIHTTRYILTYSRFIDVGRLSKLQKTSLEPLFYDSFSKNTSGIDEECVSDFGYYLYGVPQHTSNINNVGIIFILAHANSKNVIDIVEYIIQKINENPQLHSYILNFKYIFTSTVVDFVNILRAVFIDNVFSDYEHWNELLIFISETFLKINIITFIDNDIVSEETNIVLKTEYNIDETNDNIFVLETTPGVFYPIYYLDIEQYYKGLKVNKKIFSSTDEILLKIYNMIGYYSKGLNVKYIEFMNIIQSCNTDYKIEKLFTNSNNKIYAISILHNNSSFYFPIKETMYKPPNISIEFEYKVILPTIEKLTEFIQFLNNKNKDREPITYNTYLLYKDSCIGFVYRDIMYITKPFQKKTGSGIKYLKLIYHPCDVNSTLSLHSKPVEDYRSKNITKHMYEKYLYLLIIIELQRFYNNEKNTVIRNKLYKAIEKDENIGDILNDYKNDSLIIKKLIYSIKTSSKIIDIKNIIEILDNSKFSFDKITYNKLKSMNFNDLKKFIYDELKKITINSTPNFDNSFPNVLTDCKNNNIYCDNGKLIVDEKKLSLFSELISTDLKNPLKSSIIFNNISNIIDMYKFTIRKNEQIKIIM